MLILCLSYFITTLTAKKDKLKPRANVFLTGNLKSFTLQFNEKIVKQVQIENSYISGGKFEIKDKIFTCNSSMRLFRVSRSAERFVISAIVKSV